MLLPALKGARESARTTVCASNIRQLAIGSLSYSNDSKGYYCSGNFDNRRVSGFGPINTTGWVADLVNGGYGLPGAALCPSSPSRSSENLRISRTGGGSGGYPVTIDDQVYTALSATEIKTLITRGYNTNYCQSWYMSSTATVSIYPDRAPNPKDRVFVQGPLRESQLLTAPPERVPFFGDAAALTTTLADGTAPDYVILPDDTQTPGCKALTDGPVQGVVPGIGPCWTRQNYTDFGPTHGKGGLNLYGNDKVYGSIGFADGHVSTFADRNKDGQFGYTQAIIQGINTVKYDELEPKVFGGWLNHAGLPF
jgi:hypothetical protein